MAEHALFKIGEQEIRVPALTLYDLERFKNEIDKLGPDLHWVEYATTVIQIVAGKTTEDDLDFINKQTELKKACSVAEMSGLVTSFNELLRVSGFPQAGEAPAAGSDGTGTSTPSPQNSQSAASAAETPSGSNVH